MKIDCSPVVLDWPGRFAAADLYTTAISKAGILSGISILPVGRRRTGLELAALSIPDFEGCGIALHDPWSEG